MQKANRVYSNGIRSTISIVILTISLMALSLGGWLDRIPINAFLFMLFIYAIWYAIGLTIHLWSNTFRRPYTKFIVLMRLIGYLISTVLIIGSTLFIASVSIISAVELSEVTGSEVLSTDDFITILVLLFIAIWTLRARNVTGLTKFESHALHLGVSLYSAIFVGSAVQAVILSSDLNTADKLPAAIIVAIYLQYIAQHILLNTGYFKFARDYSDRLHQKYNDYLSSHDRPARPNNDGLKMLFVSAPMLLTVLIFVVVLNLTI